MAAAATALMVAGMFAARRRHATQEANAALDSPTGTGKTLCLLCACLAWQQHRKGAVNQHQQRSGLVEVDRKLKTAMANRGTGWDTLAEASDAKTPVNAAEVYVPKILYASRTHTQLSQCVKELKCTVYKPSVCTLASREQLCINPRVQELDSNAAKTAACRIKVKARSCSFFNQHDRDKQASAGMTSQGVMDIEDLVAHGMEAKVCPYYHARNNIESADIVVLPYNYIINGETRRAQKVSLAGNIVIFDEAHNIEQSSQEAASFDLKPMLIAGCMSNLDTLLSKEDNSWDSDERLEDQDLLLLKDIFDRLEVAIEKLNIGSDPEEGKSWPGAKIFDLFEGLGINFESVVQLQDTLSKAAAQLTSAAASSYGPTVYLTGFIDILKTVFCPEAGRDRDGFCACFRMHVKTEAKKGRRSSKSSTKQSGGWGTNAEPTMDSHTTKTGRTLSFWCFTPGLAMEEFERHGTHSIILTSGTLTPLPSFVSELRIKVPVTLENPHVIDQKQIWVGVVCAGPSGNQLSSAYANRGKRSYQLDLGNTIVNFARIVPHGVLVFFPSYAGMKTSLECWREPPDRGRSIWERIDQYKTPLVEPQNKTEFKQAIDAFYEKIKDPGTQGAIFFAVCRGKVSEGVDFADNNGRAVIITGMPFPPFKDTKVVLKRSYLDQQRRSNQKGLSGQDWYSQQSSRAVNQAIGRVIRHRHDFGAIIFCDERFSQPKNIAQLPCWVRPRVQVYEKFGESQGKLTKFFKACSQDPSLRAHAKAGPSGAAASSAVPSSMTAAEYAATLNDDGAGAGAVAGGSNMAGYSFAKRDRKKRRRVAASGGAAGAAHAPGAGAQQFEPPESPVLVEPKKPKQGALFSSLSQHRPDAVYVQPPEYDMGALAPVSVQRSGSGGGGSSGGAAPGARGSGGGKRPNPLDPSWKAGGAGQNLPAAPLAKPRKKRSLYSASKELGEATIDNCKEDGGKTRQIANYVDRVKRILEKDDFRRFTKLIKTYKKGEGSTGPDKANAMATMIKGFRILFNPQHLGAVGDELLNEFASQLAPETAERYREGVAELENGPASAPARLGGATQQHQGRASALTSASGSRPAAPAAVAGSGGRAHSAHKHNATPTRPAAGARPLQNHTSAMVAGLLEGAANTACAKCGRKPPTAPFSSAQCAHACCYSCWAELIHSGDQRCPRCSKGFRKRDLKKVHFT